MDRSTVNALNSEHKVTVMKTWMAHLSPKSFFSTGNPFVLQLLKPSEQFNFRSYPSISFRDVEKAQQFQHQFSKKFHSQTFTHHIDFNGFFYQKEMQVKFFFYLSY